MYILHNYVFPHYSNKIILLQCLTIMRIGMKIFLIVIKVTMILKTGFLFCRIFFLFDVYVWFIIIVYSVYMCMTCIGVINHDVALCRVTQLDIEHLVETVTIETGHSKYSSTLSVLSLLIIFCFHNLYNSILSIFKTCDCNFS